MRLKPYSYNGNAINDGSNFRAFMPDIQVSPRTDPIKVERSENFPLHTGKRLNGIVVPVTIEMMGNGYQSQIDTLKRYFDPSKQDEYKFIATDPDNSSKQWYVYASVTGIIEPTYKTITVLLNTTNPVWETQTQNDTTWAVTGTEDTETIAVIGNKEAKPIFEITPTDAKSGAYDYKRFVQIYNRTDNNFINYPINVCGTVLDTDALVTASKMEDDGNDLRVFMDGSEVDRWLQGIDTTDTKVWINIDLAPKIEVPISVAIADSGDITTISFNTYKTYTNSINRLPSSGILMIDDELFTYTGIDYVNKYVSGVTRSAKGTSAAEHTVGDTARWIQHDIYMIYGKSEATAPDTDDDYKPIINLTSTNTSWDYDVFRDTEGLRTGSWVPSVNISTGGESSFYTGSHTAMADPATEMGAIMKNVQYINQWKAESALIFWTLFHPAGITHVSSDGDIYRLITDWPLARLLYGNDGNSWTTKWTLDSPGSATTWTSWTKNAEALGATYNYVAFAFYGNLSATANNGGYMETQNATVTLDSDKVPSVTLLGETGDYHLDCRITNNATGEYIEIVYPMTLNQTLTIDCDNKTAVYEYDNSNAIAGVTFSSVRAGWLDMNVGNNELQYDETGCAGLTIHVKWKDRAL